MNDHKPVKLTNKCDLCRNARVISGSGFRGKPDLECPWCKAVRMKYGSYWYPERPLAESPKQTPITTTEERLRQIVRDELAHSRSSATASANSDTGSTGGV